MPPLRGIESLTGEALSAFETSGHGRRFAIVDPSYDIPRWAQTVYSRSDSGDTFYELATVLPIEGKISLMHDDDHTRRCEAQLYFEDAIKDLSIMEKPIIIKFDTLHRLDEQQSKLAVIRSGAVAIKGFYSTADNKTEDTLFLRTTDEFPYACATGIIGHAQTA